MDLAITPYLILKNSILKCQNKLTDFLSLPKMFQNPYIGQIYIHKGQKIPTAEKKILSPFQEYVSKFIPK